MVACSRLNAVSDSATNHHQMLRVFANLWRLNWTFILWVGGLGEANALWRCRLNVYMCGLGIGNELAGTVRRCN